MTIPAKQVFFWKFLKRVKQVAVEYYVTTTTSGYCGGILRNNNNKTGMDY